MHIPGIGRSKTWFCGRWLAGIVGSNPAGGMDICLLGVLCCQSSLRRADHSSRGVLLSVCVRACVCVCVCVSVSSKPQQ
jgi:hypothetical protein